MTDAPKAGWSNNERIADRMVVVEISPEHWLVMPTDGRPNLAYCPCCGSPFTEARFAANAADAIYPPR